MVNGQQCYDVHGGALRDKNKRVYPSPRPRVSGDLAGGIEEAKHRLVVISIEWWISFGLLCYRFSCRRFGSIQRFRGDDFGSRGGGPWWHVHKDFLAVINIGRLHRGAATTALQQLALTMVVAGVIFITLKVFYTSYESLY
jgi:hypothetical protein